MNSGNILIGERSLIEISELPQKLSTPYGTFVQHTFTEKDNGKEHLALTMGTWCICEAVPVRIHSECLTGDVFGSARCDCGDQLELTMELFQSWGVGVLIYLRQEGRGIGLANKIKAYELQDRGLDTVEANLALGFSADDRRYDFVPDILKHLEVGSVELLTNNPAKVLAMQNSKVNVTGRVSVETDTKPESISYMRTKVDKMGHMLSKHIEYQRSEYIGSHYLL